VEAEGTDQDPPQKIEIFLDHNTQPAHSEVCNGDSICYAAWAWHTHGLEGRHTLTAEAQPVVPPTESVRSDPIYVIVMAKTRLTTHRARHPATKHPMVETGRIRSVNPGHPPAVHVPVTLDMVSALDNLRTFTTHTNSQGRYRFKVRATTNSAITVSAGETRRYFGSERKYKQYVRGRPHCRLSRNHTKVKHPVVLSCRFRNVPGGTKYQVQERYRGTWVRAASFRTHTYNSTKLFITPSKRETLTVREVFARNKVWDRSSSNAVRLHVT
jgi:hypothetical protein